MARRTNLPQTIPECHAPIHELDERIETLERENRQLRNKVQSLEQEVVDLKSEISLLKAEIKALQRALFGSPRERHIGSEDSAAENTPRSTPAATSVQSQPAVSSAAVPSKQVRHSIEPRGKRTSAGRKPRVWDPDWPREQVLHTVREHVFPLDMRNSPDVRRFFRLVREDLEIQRPGMKVIQHYEEVLTLTDAKTQVTRVLAATRWSGLRILVESRPVCPSTHLPGVLWHE